MKEMNLTHILLIGILVIIRFNICYSAGVKSQQDKKDVVIISWDPVPAATSYQIFQKKNTELSLLDKITDMSQTKYEFKNFKPFTKYTIEVHVEEPGNIYNVGEVTFETWPIEPSAPKINEDETSSKENTITVTWEGPAVTNGIIESYTIKLNETVRPPLVGNVLQQTITDLEFSTPYIISVRAKTKPNQDGEGGGDGPYSQEFEVITKRKKLPAPVGLELFTYKVGEITGVWTNIELPEGVPEVKYSFDCSPVKTEKLYLRMKNLQITETKNSATRKNLSPYTNYTCSVKAIDEYEYGDSASAEIRTLPTIPDPPTNINPKNIENYQVDVSWENPKVKNGPLDRVIVFARNGDTDVLNCIWEGTGDTSCVIKRLKPYTEYMFTAAGENDKVGDTDSGGRGNESVPLWLYTPPGVPGIPTDVKVIAEEEGSLTVSWVNPTDANGPLDKTTATASSDSGLPGVCYAVNKGQSCKIKNLNDYTTYIVTVSTFNEPLDSFGGGTSERTTEISERTLAGKPKPDELNQISEALSSSKTPVPDGKTQIPIYLKLSVINTTRMGPLSKVTVVVALGDTSKKSDAAGSNKLLSRSGDRFVDGTYKDPTKGVYEVLVPIANVQSPQDLEFIVGSPSAAETNGHNYNGPLTPGSTYSISARIYTESGYETTRPIIQTTNAGVNVGLIVGLVVGAIVLIALIALIIVLVKRRNTTPDDDSYSKDSDDDVVQI